MGQNNPALLGWKAFSSDTYLFKIFKIKTPSKFLRETVFNWNKMWCVVHNYNYVCHVCVCAKGFFLIQTCVRFSQLPNIKVGYLRGRVNNSLQPYFFSSHGCIYTKVAVSTSSMNLCLSCHVTWAVLHAWLHYGISIKIMHFGHC